MINYFRVLSAVFAVSLLVTGCADLAPQKRESVSSVARVCHERIALAGRFSVQYQKNGKDESVHGSFRWAQNGQNIHIALAPPLGQTLATIDITRDSATLTSSGGVSRTAADPDALARGSLGWPLPVSGLRDWLQACTLDAQGSRRALAPESESTITVDGWEIAYPIWESADTGMRRPKRIDVHRSTDGEWTEISLRLVIDEWQPSQ
jgi:outer membrane lipoprotein LolB